MPMTALLKNIGKFYRHDCCWPYAVSILLVPVIYWQDLFVAHTRHHWASLCAFGVILAYYLYIIYRYFQHGPSAGNQQFFVTFLSIKIVILGVLLGLLCAIK